MNNTFKIGSKTIGNDKEPFIIAEAGINHNGNIIMAKKMIVAAKKAGVDAVKFQTFHTEAFIQDKSEMYTYKSQGIEVTEPQFEIFKRTEFTEEQWKELKKFCDEQKITFLSTPVSTEDAKLLINMGVEAIKIGSDDFINLPLLHKYAEFDVPIIMSTGMATEEEMRKSLNAVGTNEGHPTCLMLCTSEYPTPPQDVNAAKLLTMAEKFPGIILGLSDHTLGNISAIIATALGARVFEKHFTLDHNLPGPDQWFSADPEELREWTDAIRTAYCMLGNSELKPTKREETMRKVARRSITSIKDISAGEIFSTDNLALLRPGNGMAPEEWINVIGKTSAHSINSGKQIKWEDIKN